MAIADIMVAIINIYSQYYFRVSVEPKKAILYDRMLDNMKYLIGTCIVFQVFMWIKVMAFLKLTHKYGSIVKIIELMILDLINFSVLFGLILIGFGSVMCFIL